MKTLYFVEISTAGSKNRFSSTRRDGPFHDVVTAEQYALRVHEQPYVVGVTVVPATEEQALDAVPCRADRRHQVEIIRAAYMDTFEERALMALSGPEFARYDQAHGQYEADIYRRALRGERSAIQQMYARLRATANGIDYCGNGGTHRDRIQAAADCLAVWDR